MAVAMYQNLVNKEKVCSFAKFLAKLLCLNYDSYHKTASCFPVSSCFFHLEILGACLDFLHLFSQMWDRQVSPH